MRISLLGLLFLISTSAFSQAFIEGGLGYIRWRDPFLESINKRPTGINLVAIGGYKLGIFAAEAFIGKANHQVLIKHDGVHYFHHIDDTYYGAGARAYLDMFYMRAGYALHSITPSIRDHPANSKTLTDVTAATYYKADNKSYSSSGIYFGFGIEYALSNLFGVYGQSSFYDLSAEGTNTFTFDIGIRMTFGSGGGGGGGGGAGGGN